MIATRCKSNCGEKAPPGSDRSMHTARRNLERTLVAKGPPVLVADRNERIPREESKRAATAVHDHEIEMVRDTPGFQRLRGPVIVGDLLAHRNRRLTIVRIGKRRLCGPRGRRRNQFVANVADELVEDRGSFKSKRKTGLAPANQIANLRLQVEFAARLSADRVILVCDFQR
jgi:predicted AAA+ superfamily ATPase